MSSLQMLLRKNKKRKKEISLEDSLNYDSEGNELHLEDVLGTDNDLVSEEYERQVERNFISKEINKLKFWSFGTVLNDQNFILNLS